MKIAVMMRVTDQDTGLGFFTDVLVRTPLQMDRMNSYLLLYKEPKHLGAKTSWPLREFCQRKLPGPWHPLGVLLFVVAVPLSLVIARLPIGPYRLGTFKGRLCSFCPRRAYLALMRLR